MPIQDIIQDYISEEDLKRFEDKYNLEKRNGTLNETTKFEYSWCLIRSQYKDDIRTGVTLLEGLCSSKTDQRDFLFFISIGYYKLADYSIALKYVKRLLGVEPGNHQAKDLELLIQQKLKSDGLLGMAMVGGAALVAAGAVLLGMTVTKR